MQLLNDPREGIGAAIMRGGSVEPQHRGARSRSTRPIADLIKLNDDVRVKVAINGYETLPTGRIVLGQVWSGDMLAAAISYLPEDVPATALSYAFQEEGGPVANDIITVAAAAQKPVMAHRFLNFMLDDKIALENFVDYVGYQPPIKSINADALVEDEVIPPNLANVLVTPEAYANANAYLALTGRGAAPLGPRLAGVPGGLTWRRAGSGACSSAPGLLFLGVFFLVAFYAVVAVGMGNVTTLFEPVPHWNPLDWNVGYLLAGARATSRPAARRGRSSCGRSLYVVVAMTLSLLIGYPVAYYAARHAGRWRGLDPRAARPAVLDHLPHADVRLDEPARVRRLRGARRCNALGIDQLFNTLGLLDGDDWLGGQPITVILALVYGYVPFFILPLYASLDRIDQRLIEAARDLGASSGGDVPPRDAPASRGRASSPASC